MIIIIVIRAHPRCTSLWRGDQSQEALATIIHRYHTHCKLFHLDCKLLPVGITFTIELLRYHFHYNILPVDITFNVNHFHFHFTFLHVFKNITIVLCLKHNGLLIISSSCVFIDTCESFFSLNWTKF